MTINLSVVRLDGCYTRETLDPDMPKYVWMVDFTGVVREIMWFMPEKCYLHMLDSGRVYPTKELAEAAALSLSGGMALGDRLIEHYKDLDYLEKARNGDPKDGTEVVFPDEKLRAIRDSLQSILGIKGEGK